jgi:hypothetical protein
MAVSLHPALYWKLENVLLSMCSWGIDPETFALVSLGRGEWLITPKGGKGSEDCHEPQWNTSFYLPRSAVSLGGVSRKGSSWQPSWTAKTNPDCE